jgi:hypothetical protein
MTSSGSERLAIGWFLLVGCKRMRARDRHL